MWQAGTTAYGARCRSIAGCCFRGVVTLKLCLLLPVCTTQLAHYQHSARACGRYISNHRLREVRAPWLVGAWVALVLSALVPDTGTLVYQRASDAVLQCSRVSCSYEQALRRVERGVHVGKRGASHPEHRCNILGLLRPRFAAVSVREGDSNDGQHRSPWYVLGCRSVMCHRTMLLTLSRCSRRGGDGAVAVGGAFILGLYTRLATPYHCVFLINEFSTPFVNFHHFMVVSKHRGPAFTINGVLMWLSFFVFRMVFNSYVVVRVVTAVSCRGWRWCRKRISFLSRCRHACMHVHAAEHPALDGLAIPSRATAAGHPAGVALLHQPGAECHLVREDDPGSVEGTRRLQTQGRVKGDHMGSFFLVDALCSFW